MKLSKLLVFQILADIASSTAFIYVVHFENIVSYIMSTVVIHNLVAFQIGKMNSVYFAPESQ